MAGGLGDLHRRRRLGHDDDRRDAEPLRVISHGLRVIAGRGRDHPARALLGRQLQQFVERAAFLVGGGELQILELEPDFRAGDFRQGLADQHRRAHDISGDSLTRGADVVDRRRLHGCRLEHGRGLALQCTANNAMPAFMNRPLLALLALLSSSAMADTLVSNVNGIQVGSDGQLQHFSGLIVADNGKVKAVLTGSPPPIAFAHTVDGGGRTMLPGLIDGHGHVMDLGFAALRIDVTGTRSIAELQQRLRDYAAAHPNDKWIVGFGWNQEMWAEKRFPTSADLDAVVSDRPVVLERVDGHAVVANSAALKAAGITAATQAPPGGEIHDGVFVDNARDLVDKAIPKPTQQQEGPGARQVAGDPAWLWGHRRRRDEHHRRRLERVPPCRRGRAFERAPDELFAGHGIDCRGPQADRLAVRRSSARGRDQVPCRWRARLARRVAEAALCRQAGIARASVPFGCRDAEPRRYRRRARLPGRDPRHRRCRQCASHRRVRAARQEISRRQALADRAFPDRRPGRHPAARAGRDHRLDAADPSDQRPR